MRIKGVVFSGVLRGKPLVDIYYYRLVGILGFEPYKGTMDVKLVKSIDITLYATKTLDHIIMDGTKIVNAQLAPVNLILQREGEEKYPCWAMQQTDGIYTSDVVEIVSKDKIKARFGIEDGSIVELEFFEKPEKDKKPHSILERLRPKKEVQIMRRM